jgi:hypothetical protein
MPTKRPIATIAVVVAVLAAGCLGFEFSGTEQQSTTTGVLTDTTTMSSPSETTAMGTTTEGTTTVGTTAGETTHLYRGDPVLSVENISDEELSRFDADQITSFDNLTAEQRAVFLEAHRNGSAELDDEFDFTDGPIVVKYNGDNYKIAAENA